MKRVGFTLLEMIFVIVVLGIIATITTDIIGSLFRNYNNAKVLNDLTLKTSNALTIIKKRLDRAIEDSVVYIDDSNSPSGYKAVFEKPLTGDLNISDGALLWIGKDVESFKLSGTLSQNGYSGFANILASEKNKLSSPESMFESIALNDSNSTQFDITGVNLVSGTNYRSVVYFPYFENSGTAEDRFWANGQSSLYEINGTIDDQNLTLAEDMNVTENYSLSYSAYAITLEGGNLNLHYNFRPWIDEELSDGDTPQVIIDNVSDFKFWSEANGGLLRLQICVSSGDYMTSSSDSEKFTFCKESAVIMR